MTVKTNSVIGSEARNLLLYEVIIEHSVKKERFLPAVGMTMRWVLIGLGTGGAAAYPQPLSQKKEAVISNEVRNLFF